MAWLNRILVALGLVGAVAYVPRGISYGTGLEDLHRARGERDDLRKQIHTVRADIRVLRAEVQALKSDRSEFERIAREDLNLVRPGEFVFEVEDPSRRQRSKNKGRDLP